ncbi:nucleolin [Aedes albopictus]|uniref:RRM domain-containing protein n=1 Tax=Aedes albopictus TaxID=7160 RepID=A0ABM1YRU8_AEDAL
MAVKGKKAQKQQEKPSPKLVKHQEEEEEDDDEEEEDVESDENEEQEEQSDEEVAEQEEKDDEDEDEDEDEESDDEEDTKQVEKKEPAPVEGDMKTTIFVGHINYQLSKKELEDFFSKAGEVQSSRIITKRGYGFVTFTDAASVEEALKLDKEMLAGKAVHVERVKSKKTDHAQKAQLKRKANKEENEKGAKKAKLGGGKTVQLKKGFNKGGKGRPKTAQHTNPNKKKNKQKPGKFVKAQE